MLVVYGAGIPPGHVTDSGMAELWAVWTAIEMSPAVPRITTDCLGILNTARAGTAAAIAAGNMNARIWRLIAGALDGDITTLDGKLVWMPAHQNQKAIGERFKSNGHRISNIDFRANRLVDKLAAHRHERNAAADKGKQLVKQVRSAAKTALATLGQVTWAANNCEMKVVGDDGKETTKMLRDSTNKPIKKVLKEAKNEK
jgi:hypothetical protein